MDETRGLSLRPLRGRRGVLVATALLVPTLLCTLIARTGAPELFRAVRRDPAVWDGELWRLVTPVLVQPDPWLLTGLTFSLVWIAYLVVVRVLGVALLLVGYLAGTLPAEILGTFWVPFRGGVSVTGLGAVALLSVFLFRRGRRWPLLLWLGLGLWLSYNRDVHGPALLGGLAVGLLLVGLVRTPDEPDRPDKTDRPGTPVPRSSEGLAPPGTLDA